MHLAAQDIVDLHDEALRRTGGESGILSPSAIHAAVDRHAYGPFHGDGDAIERAAYLMRGIIQDHPFVDGNKRTAVEATWTYLRRHRIRLVAAADDVVAFALAAAQGLTVHEIEAWLRDHTQTLSADGPKEV